MTLLYRTLKRYWIILLASIFLSLLSFIPVRLAIAHYQAPQPQAILTLGGEPQRETATAEIARYYPHLDIWVSSGEQPDQARAIFQSAGVSEQRLHLDYRATDTVTNFTTLVPEFQQRQIHHLYLVTSEFHMPRAQVIATIVLGSRGIAFTPITVPSKRAPESTLRIVRDGCRSVLWVTTGWTGASLRDTRFNLPINARISLRSLVEKGKRFLTHLHEMR